jgi:4-diphosphocytidyl-2-C-methyl-D-erythritol kinase
VIRAVWEAPAKVNLSLEVRSRDRQGYHPVRSLVQTIDRVDLLAVGVGEDERLVVTGADIPDGEENLVWKAVRALVGRPDRPRLDMELEKRIPHAAGLGGGSSNAAAALRGAADVFGLNDGDVRTCAPLVGADVPFFLDGGTAWMEGHGELLTEVQPLKGFCLAVAVPRFEISSAAAYRRWDDLGEPRGRELSGRHLPPELREYGALRNDLTAAAISLEPELGDWSVDLAERWERPVAMTGSGSAFFAFFMDPDEATDAAGSVSEARAAFVAGLRDTGVAAR